MREYKATADVNIARSREKLPLRFRVAIELGHDGGSN